MLILRNNRQYTTVTHGSDILFNKNSPNFGGKLSENLLDELGLAPMMTGKWAIRTINDNIAGRLMGVINGMDMRKAEDRVRVPAVMGEFKDLILEVEKI